MKPSKLFLRDKTIREMLPHHLDIGTGSELALNLSAVVSDGFWTIGETTTAHHHLNSYPFDLTTISARHNARENHRTKVDTQKITGTLQFGSSV
ncbi:hypothetical protein [Planococcus donghaensis]|uniref:hypothetical protein n=1 Tax=Planococcus donghaensis TaxID=414778 RepID=UPI00373578ED